MLAEAVVVAAEMTIVRMRLEQHLRRTAPRPNNLSPPRLSSQTTTTQHDFRTINHRRIADCQHGAPDESSWVGLQQLQGFTCTKLQQYTVQKKQRSVILPPKRYANPLTTNIVIPHFTPTSQPELDAILSKYREEVFVPEILSQAHRRLMYRPTRHPTLLNDTGVSVSVTEEEEIRLQPKFLTNRPERAKTMARIAKLLGDDESGEAWSNLRPFLEGLKASHWKVPESFFEQICRKANILGLHRVIVECVEQAETTGAELSQPYLARELLQGAHQRALEDSFKGEEFERSRKLAQHIVFLLERTEHCGTKKTFYQSGQYDMRRSLFVNSVLLEMNAARTLHASDKPTDTTGEVGRGVARVLALSQGPEPGVADFTMEEFAAPQSETASKSGDFGRASQRLENLLPVWSGLKFASKIPDAVASGSKSAFQKTLAQATEEVKMAEAEVKRLAGDNLERRSLLALKQLRSIHA